MEEKLKTVEEIVDNDLKLPDLNDVLPLAKLEADSKGLQVFVFEKQDLEKYFTVKIDTIGVVTISKNIDSALWNLQNFRHSYLVKIPESTDKV